VLLDWPPPSGSGRNRPRLVQHINSIRLPWHREQPWNASHSPRHGRDHCAALLLMAPSRRCCPLDPGMMGHVQVMGVRLLRTVISHCLPPSVTASSHPLFQASGYLRPCSSDTARESFHRSRRSARHAYGAVHGSLCDLAALRALSPDPAVELQQQVQSSALKANSALHARPLCSLLQADLYPPNGTTSPCVGVGSAQLKEPPKHPAAAERHYARDLSTFWSSTNSHYGCAIPSAPFQQTCADCAPVPTKGFPLPDLPAACARHAISLLPMLLSLVLSVPLPCSYII
jgi:hypothetical protein